MSRAAAVISRFLSGLLTAALALILGCNLYILAARSLTGNPQPDVFGWSSAVVVSGSMSGSIEIHDMVIVRRADAYAPGDVISFRSGSAVVTHRILRQTEEGYITKGDANNVPDTAPVPTDAVIGKVVLVIPGIGKLIEILRSPLGLTCLILLGIALILLTPQQSHTGAARKGGKYAKKRNKQ